MSSVIHRLGWRVHLPHSCCEGSGRDGGGCGGDGDGDGGSRNHDHIHLLVDLWAPSAGDRVVCKRISYCLHMAYHTMSRVDRSRTPPRECLSLAGALIIPRRLIKTFNSDCGGDLWPGLMYDFLISHEDKEYWAYKDFGWRFTAYPWKGSWVLNGERINPVSRYLVPDTTEEECADVEDEDRIAVSSTEPWWEMSLVHENEKEKEKDKENNKDHGEEASRKPALQRCWCCGSEMGPEGCNGGIRHQFDDDTSDVMGSSTEPEEAEKNEKEKEKDKENNKEKDKGTEKEEEEKERTRLLQAAIGEIPEDADNVAQWEMLHACLIANEEEMEDEKEDGKEEVEEEETQLVENGRRHQGLVHHYREERHRQSNDFNYRLYRDAGGENKPYRSQ